MLVIAIAGCSLVIEAPVGQVVLFKAWLPHLTRTAEGSPLPAPTDWRLHHTAYCRFKTEFFGWVARTYRLKGVPFGLRSSGSY